MGHCPGRGIRRGPLLSPPGGSRPYFFFCSSVIVACNLLITVSSSRVHGLEIEYWKNSCNPSRGSFRRRSEDKHAIRPTGAPLGRFSPHPGAFPWGQQTRSAGPRRTKAVSHPAAGPILATSPRAPTQPVCQLAHLCGLSIPGSGLLTLVNLDDCIGHGCEHSLTLQDVCVQ